MRRAVIYEQHRAGNLPSNKQQRAELIPAPATAEYAALLERNMARVSGTAPIRTPPPNKSSTTFLNTPLSKHDRPFRRYALSSAMSGCWSGVSRSVGGVLAGLGVRLPVVCTMRPVSAALLDLVRADCAGANLRTYFGEDAPLPYTGRRFEALDGGGDRPANRDVITGSDLIAVQMLSVKFPGEVAIDLLDGDLGRQMTRLLAEIPTDVDLGTDGAEALVADGNHADQAWHLVEKRRDVGYVIAGKLMARKRPRLIPVYDRVLSCLFGAPDHLWLRLHHQLAANNGELRVALADVHAGAEIPATVGLLRVLDVVLGSGTRHRAAFRLLVPCPRPPNRTCSRSRASGSPRVRQDPS